MSPYSNPKCKNRILVVDDDPDIRFELKEYLTDHGFDVSTAADGEAMRLQMAESGYDLVIMDLMLPGDDGLTLTRYIQRRFSIPVIMITAREETIERIIGLEMGADDYVAKPFEPREILARIRSVLRRVSFAAETAAQDPGTVVKFEDRQTALKSRRPAPSDRHPRHSKAKFQGGTNAPSRVIGPTGEPLAIEDLPPPDTRRWVLRRKAEVVAAVRGGLISQEEACRRYNMSADELASWQYLILGGGRRDRLSLSPQGKRGAERKRRVGRLVLNFDNRTVEVDGQNLQLTPKEFAILELLSSHQGEVVVKESIISRLYGDGGEPNSKTIDVFICNLRAKLAAATGGANFIATKWGWGYRLRDPNAHGSTGVLRTAGATVTT